MNFTGPAPQPQQKWTDSGMDVTGAAERALELGY